MKFVSEMIQIAGLIRLFAVAAGLVALTAPVLAVIRQARIPRGRFVGKTAGKRPWPVVLGMTVGFVGIGVFLWRPVSSDISAGLDLALSLVGAVCYFLGVGIYLWGLTVLGKQFGVSSAFSARLYQGHKLVTGGPFALIRHPMYAGVILAAVGALLIFQTQAMLLFTPLSFTVIVRVDREETFLEQEFGGEWKAYAERVPKWFPRV